LSAGSARDLAPVLGPVLDPEQALDRERVSVPERVLGPALDRDLV